LDVAIPRDVIICVDDGGATSSHGFLVILEPDVSCKAFEQHHRHINVYVGFEVAYDAQSVAELAEARCGRSLVLSGELQDISIPGHTVSVCRDIDFNRDENGKVISSGDRAETKAMALLDGVELSVSLVTTEPHVSADMGHSSVC